MQNVCSQWLPGWRGYCCLNYLLLKPQLFASPSSCCPVHLSTNTPRHSWGTPGRTIKSARRVAPQGHIWRMMWDFQWGQSSAQESTTVSPASAIRAAGQESQRSRGLKWTPSLARRHLLLPYSLTLPDKRTEWVSVNWTNTALKALCTVHRMDMLSPIPVGVKQVWLPLPNALCISDTLAPFLHNWVKGMRSRTEWKDMALDILVTLLPPVHWKETPLGIEGRCTSSTGLLLGRSLCSLRSLATLTLFFYGGRLHPQSLPWPNQVCFLAWSVFCVLASSGDQEW